MLLYSVPLTITEVWSNYVFGLYSFGDKPATPAPSMIYAMNTSQLGADSSENGHNMQVQNVNLVQDSERGPVAKFSGYNSALMLRSWETPSFLSGAASRSYVYWVKHNKALGTRKQTHDNGGDPRNARLWMLLNEENKQHINSYGGEVDGSIEVPANT